MQHPLRNYLEEEVLQPTPLGIFLPQHRDIFWLTSAFWEPLIGSAMGGGVATRVSPKHTLHTEGVKIISEASQNEVYKDKSCAG